MSTPIRILLQTTIAAVEDDWNIDRFSLLFEHLSSITDDHGNSLYEATARNREADADGNDKVLSKLDSSEFDEIWIFAVDPGDGLSVADCEGITRFLFFTRGTRTRTSRDTPATIRTRQRSRGQIIIQAAMATTN